MPGPARGTLACGEIRLRTEPMLRINGYSQLDRVHPHVQEVARQMARRAETLFRPELWYRLLNIRERTEAGLVLETGAFLRCGEFAQSSSAVVAFVLTMGEAFDIEAQSLSATGKVLDRLFFETAGWLGVEAATRTLAERLREWSRPQGYALTRRHAPGYQGWPLTDQQAMFSLFEGVPMSVQLLESCVMVPTMSRSGLYGLRRSSA